MVNFDTNFEHRNGGSKELEQASDDAEAMDRDDAWQRQLDEWRRLTGIDGSDQCGDRDGTEVG